MTVSKVLRQCFDPMLLTTWRVKNQNQNVWSRY